MNERGDIKEPRLGHRDWLVLRELRLAKQPVAAYSLWKKIHEAAPSCASMKPQQANNAFATLERYGFSKKTAPPLETTKPKGQVPQVLVEGKVPEIEGLAQKWADDLSSAEKWTDNDLARFCEAADVIEFFLGRKAVQRMVRLRQTAIEKVNGVGGGDNERTWPRRAREALKRLAALEGELLDRWQGELYEQEPAST